MRFLLLTLFIGFINPINQFDLKADLKADKLVITREPNGDVMLGTMKFQIFDKYSKINLTGYIFKSTNIRKHIVKSWTSANHKLVIYEVITPTHVDKIYVQPNLILDSATKKYVRKHGEKLHIKGDFTFHTYVIREVNKEQLIYQQERHHGLCEYRIGKQRFFPSYESVEVGFQAPKIEEILSLLPN